MTRPFRVLSDYKESVTISPERVADLLAILREYGSSSSRAAGVGIPKDAGVALEEVLLTGTEPEQVLVLEHLAALRAAGGDYTKPIPVALKDKVVRKAISEAVAAGESWNPVLDALETSGMWPGSIHAGFPANLPAKQDLYGQMADWMLCVRTLPCLRRD